jgi:RNA polymerase-binding transcription factor DksA
MIFFCLRRIFLQAIIYNSGRSINVRDFSGIKEQLLAIRTEMEARLGGIKKDMANPLDHDFAEQAVELENGEVLDALGAEALAEIRKVNSALVRLEDGQYGTCVDCFAEIPMARLDARPYSSRCIGCAAKKESAKKR